MNKDEVLKLAKLARIEIGDAEATSLAHEFEAILQYVGEIKKATVETSQTDNYPTRNTLREDTNPHEAGIYTEAILGQAPRREGDFLKVKNIL